MANPWELTEPQGKPPWNQPWGPGTIEDYAKFTGQTDEKIDPIEAFDWFITRNVDTKWQGHLLDSDDNDGEYVRRAIRKALKRAAKKGK